MSTHNLKIESNIVYSDYFDIATSQGIILRHKEDALNEIISIISKAFNNIPDDKWCSIVVGMKYEEVK